MDTTNIRIENEIGKVIHGANGEWGVIFKELPDGIEIRFNANKVFSSASLIKLPILASVMIAASSGKINLNSRLEIDQTKYITNGQDAGSGIIAHLSTPATLTILDLCYLMVVVSDNLATDILIDILGFPYINRIFKQLKLRKTKVNHKLVDFNHLIGMNPTTPLDICLLLEQIYKKELPFSEAMMDILKGQIFNSRIPLLIPFEEIEDGNITVAHKTGTIKTIAHDAGIITTPLKDYALCILTQNQDNISTTNLRIAQLSENIYKIISSVIIRDS